MYKLIFKRKKKKKQQKKTKGMVNSLFIVVDWSISKKIYKKKEEQKSERDSIPSFSRMCRISGLSGEHFRKNLTIQECDLSDFRIMARSGHSSKAVEEYKREIPKNLLEETEILFGRNESPKKKMKLERI